MIQGQKLTPTQEQRQLYDTIMMKLGQEVVDFNFSLSQEIPLSGRYDAFNDSIKIMDVW